MIDSISVTAVKSSSWVRLVWPTIFLKHSFVDGTIRSNAPPHQGAFATLNVQSQPLSNRKSRTVSSLKIDFKNLEAALKVLPLSEINFRRRPLRAANLFSHGINDSVDMFSTTSRWTALVAKQVNRQIHVFSVFPSVRIISGPAKSTPVKVNGRSSFTLLTGKAAELVRGTVSLQIGNM